MTVDEIDGGTASPSSGAVALHRLAPRAAAAFDTMVSVRPSGVHDEMLEAPGVRAFADQLRTDPAGVDDTLRAGLARATGERSGAVLRIVWINDVAPRVRAGLDALFGASQWDAPRRYPVADMAVPVQEFLDGVDALSAPVADRPEASSAAEAFADAMARTPLEIPSDVVARVLEHHTHIESVALVLVAVRRTAEQVIPAPADAAVPSA